MKESRTNAYDQFLHPYVFVLKEGAQINQDFLDYSLLLLQVGQVDIIHSPHRNKNIPLRDLSFNYNK